jgi:hypothetical protein
VYLATAPEVDGVSGRYFVSCKESKTDPLAQDAALARSLWDESAALVGLA